MIRCNCGRHEGLMVQTTVHEGCVVCSFRFALCGEQSKTRRDMERLLTELGKRIRENGGFVGHIKASGAGMRYSLTSGKVDCLPTDCGPMAEGVAIVFRMTETELKQQVITEICNTMHSDFEF